MMNYEKDCCHYAILPLYINTIFTDNEVFIENIKKIDNAGQLVLGKQFAGSFVSIDSSKPNEINIKLVDVVPKNEELQKQLLRPKVLQV